MIDFNGLFKLVCSQVKGKRNPMYGYIQRIVEKLYIHLTDRICGYHNLLTAHVPDVFHIDMKMYDVRLVGKYLHMSAKYFDNGNPDLSITIIPGE